ncbi:MAG: threonine/serine exporter family protein [Gemmatimonadetes bacterium]|nr:threonine/serine exporter family protein [Gemmatimonadota bacterium]
MAYGLLSGAACQFLGGGGRESIAAAMLGLGLGIFALLIGALPRIGGVFEPMAAFLASAAAIGLAHLLGPMSVLTATVAGLIVLLPGLTLTTAMTELATRHLASGVARLSGAFSTFLTLAFGVALGNRVGETLFGAAPAAPAVGGAEWASLVALIVAPLCFTVILRAEPRDAPWIVLAGALGYERWRRRQASVVVVPGILLLVPGSVGFRSLTSLMDRQAVTGIETAFSMILTAIALVAGMLVAGVILPERRIGTGA